MLESARIRIVILGTYGFSAKCIRKNVKDYDGEEFSASSIYRVLKEEGIKLWDYRNGKTTESKKQMASLGVKRKKLLAA